MASEENDDDDCETAARGAVKEAGGGRRERDLLGIWRVVAGNLKECGRGESGWEILGEEVKLGFGEIDSEAAIGAQRELWDCNNVVVIFGSFFK